MVEAQKNIPTILVIFGITGDLVEKKVLPALFKLFSKKELPENFKIVGFSRRDFSDGDLREYIRGILEAGNDFLHLFAYKQGGFDRPEDYRGLNQFLHSIDDEWGMCSNKIFYFPVPPKHYENIFKNIKFSGLSEPCGPQGGWSRILVEKPFGRDWKSAQYFNELLSESFSEEQIFRIDHYLGKSSTAEILKFRLSENLFGENWGGARISHIHIRLLEHTGVEERGHFYDDVGALRDMGQSHLLELLALLTMEKPESNAAHEVRGKRAAVLKNLNPISEKEVVNFTYRGQHEGYRNIEGVGENSDTETYFRVECRLNISGWENVPIILESGKKLGKTVKEIEIKFRGESGHSTINLTEKAEDIRQEYEKLILDCILGDQTLFVSREEVEYMWRFIDPIIEAWEQDLVPLKIYGADSHPTETK